MNNEIKILVFDLGNVLIPFHYDIIINRLNEKEYGLGEYFVEKYKANYDVHRKFEKGEMSEKEFLSIMLDWTKHKTDAEEFKKIYSEIFTVNEQMTALLEKLKKHYRLMLLSNTNAIHQKYGWEKFPFLKHFEKLFLSHKVGAVKPEKEIYLAVQNYTEAKPDEHLFIDDVEEYVNAAKALGWHGIHFVNEEQAINELKKKLGFEIY
jgi:putative hydrolase of the HAD superfamily